MVSGLKTTADSPSPPLQWVATEDGGTAPQMTLEMLPILVQEKRCVLHMQRIIFIELGVKPVQLIAKGMTQHEHGRFSMANTANSLYQESVFSPVSGTKVVGTTISLYYMIYVWYINGIYWYIHCPQADDYECYLWLCDATIPSPFFPKPKTSINMWQLHLALSSPTACWFPVPVFQWQKLRANTWHGFSNKGNTNKWFPGAT